MNTNLLLLQNVTIGWKGSDVIPGTIPATDSLTIYGHAWHSYWVDSLDTREANAPWQFYQRIPATNDIEVINGSPRAWQAFQVHEFVRELPIAKHFYRALQQ